MEVQAYIKDKFQTFGIDMSEAEILDISLNAGVNVDDEMTTDNKRQVDIAICRFIPALLLRPQSVSEGSVSFSYNYQAVKDYYSLLCKQYGIKDELSPKPTVNFLNSCAV
jgi:hypothetical protein